MTHFHLIPLFAGIINVLLALFVVVVSPRRRLNRIFLGLGLGLAFWNLGAFSLSHVGNAEDALVLARLTMVGVIILPAMFYHFVVEAAGIPRTGGKVRAAYAGAAVFLVFNATPWFIGGVRPLPFAWFSIAGPAFWVFSSGYFPVVMTAVLVTVFSVLRRGAGASISRQFKLLLVVIALLFVGGTHDLLPVLGYDYYPNTEVRIIPWGTLVASFYGLLIGYSILSDQLLEVRVSLSEHSATALRIGFLLGIAYVLMVPTAMLFPDIFTTAGLVASLIILAVSAVVAACFFPKLLGRFTTRWEKRLLGDRFEYQDKIAAFIETASGYESSRALLDGVADLLFGAMNLSVVGVAITGGEAASRALAVRPLEGDRNWAAVLSADSALMAYFKTSGVGHLDARDASGGDEDERAAREMLFANGLQLALAIGLRREAPVGLLVLRTRRERRALTRLDIEMLERLCRSLAFQIERIAIVQTEQLRQANKAKDQFLASINHEIRNPLNGITGIVKMLAETSSDARQRFLLSTLQGCTDQLRSTMDDVLDFSQIEAERVSLVETDIELGELVATTCASFDVSGTQIVFASRPVEPVFVRGDGGKVRQILSNFLANALKYGVPPGANVALTVEPWGKAVKVKLTVTSTGPTLSEAEVATLFTPLTRGRRARETNAHGMGLGLALTRKLAEAMGGSVGVSSAGGETAFWFAVDFPRVEREEPAKRVEAPRFAGRTALAIEDERYNRLVLGHYLTQLGFTITWAEDARTALALVRRQPCDVILMDWFLPDMGGAELLAEMERVRGEALPPVIVVSAYSTTAKKAECLAAGATAFVAKPIDAEKLAAALARSHIDLAPLVAVDGATEARIDLSALLALGDRETVLGTFRDDVEGAWIQIRQGWQQDPRTAALLAHRLKAQMALVRANEAASLLALLEQAFAEKWPTADIAKMIDGFEEELEGIVLAVRRDEKRAVERENAGD
jgi:Signal transduction histidine kinase